MNNEQVIMNLIMHGGNARAQSLRAIQSGQSDDFVQAELLLADAKEEMAQAHEAQTNLIQDEVRGEHCEVSLLMVHAQDHVMNAMTVKELAEYLIQMQKEIYQLKQQMKEETYHD